jgi:2,3-bisphosphoglycerate-independent phosphoglycerate mutase
MKPLLLLILDGWGHLESRENNAIQLAKTPQWDHWMQTYPHALLDASGTAVGLPENQIGNSEVGHMHMGAGRVVYQDLCRIHHDIEEKTFFENQVLAQLCQETVKNHVTLHIMGLFSPGGVHSHQDHLFALLELTQKHQAPQVALHLFLDGRDTPPQSAIENIEKLEKALQHYPHAKIASICGRFYAMDRDHRWERIQEAYDLLTLGDKPHANNAIEAIQNAYAQGITDEFIPATVIGQSPSLIQDGDNVFFFNFRSDRAIQISEALTDEDFKGFPRKVFPHIHEFVSMVPYAKHFQFKTAYSLQKLENTLGEIFAKHHLKQLRIAETEKYPHVTYFFNGGVETIFPLEERILIASPKVKTYNLMPQMRAFEITDEIVECIKKQEFDVIIANFANADMVGHCGELSPTIEAIEVLDQCFAKLDKALKTYNAHAMITADHGNAEVMYDKSHHQKHTAHTLSPVPFLYVGKNCQTTQTHGSLVDIAPTILYLLNLPKPKEMTGTCLLRRLSNEK